MPTKSLTALALPLVVSFTFRFLFSLVDMVFLGVIHEEHPYGIAALGKFIPILSIFIAIWVGLSAGFTATISQAFGRRDQARVQQLKRAMIRIHVALVPLLLGIGAVVWSRTQALDPAPEWKDDFLLYSMILICTMPFSGFLSIYPDSIIKAHHDTISTMKAGLWSTGTNVVLNAVFVFAFHWGIAGIALATVLSRYASLIYASLRVRSLERARLTDGWDQGPSEWSRGPMTDILVLAIPGSLAYVLIAVEELTITEILTGEAASAVYLAGYAVYSRLTSLAIMPAIATGVAVLPFVARLVSEGRVAEVRHDLQKSLLVTAGLVTLIAVPIAWVFPRQIASFLMTEVIARAGDDVVWCLALVPVASLAILPFLLLRPVFEAVSRPRIGVRIAAFKTIVVGVPLIFGGYLLAPGFGVDPLIGIVVGTIVAQAIASITTAIVCRRLLEDGGNTGARGENKADFAGSGSP